MAGLFYCKTTYPPDIIRLFNGMLRPCMPDNVYYRALDIIFKIAL